MNEEIAKQTVTMYGVNNDNDSEVFGYTYHFLNDKLLVIVRSLDGEDQYIDFKLNDENLSDNIEIDGALQNDYTIRIRFNQMDFAPNELNDLEQKLVIVQKYVEEIKHIGKLFGIEFNK